MTLEAISSLILSFPNVEENPHFERAAFKVRGKRIFTTILEADLTANLKLSEVDQSVFSQINDHIYPVDNKWGKQGWTTFEFETLDEELMRDAIKKAYDAIFN
ncbi:MAG: MmcQ/YjbR family DNA-binding protein [Ekhidna sp.]|uniref:MmcQ/YjbR family DNA-binding protein n=1 Tax=Ekhidna sp. TaxID=2608089 RepID=UPI0032F0444A